MKILIGIAISLSLSMTAWAQRDEYVPLHANSFDYTYMETIKSVRLFPSDSEVDYPIISLNSGSQLVLEFDDIEGYSKNFYYKIIHCNSDWTPSEDIAAMDYLEGYAENRFYNSQTSFTTRSTYVHYELRLPNEDVQFKLSGNYLLKVYLDGDEEQLVITRRFMVLDTKMKVFAQMRRSATPPYSATHQEPFFRVQHAGIHVGNPGKEIKVVVMQNGRWDNAIFSPAPTFYENEELIYNIQGRLAFPGYKEFRPLDLRSFRFRTNQMKSINQLPTRIDVELFPDPVRQRMPYLFTNDVNGRFVVQTHDFNDILRAEYANVKFTLPTPKENGEVYIIGGFTDWQLYDQNKMTYNEEINAYEATLYLKNAFYDYYYALVPPAKGDEPRKFDLLPLEGSTYETENDYLFLVYYYPFGSRYEQLVAVQKLNTRPR